MFRFPARFARNIAIVPNDTMCDCWLWKGATSGKPTSDPDRPDDGGRGYGKVWWEGASRYAHRVMWELMTGTPPGDHVLDHLCRRRNCVNPLHLEATTVQINTLRGDAILFKVMSRYEPEMAAHPPWGYVTSHVTDGVTSHCDAHVTSHASQVENGGFQDYGEGSPLYGDSMSQEKPR